LFLVEGISYEALVKWFNTNQSLKSPEKTVGRIATSKLQHHSNDLHKIPNFRLTKFKGDALPDDGFIAAINRAFRSATIAQFLNSEICCENSPMWSNAFTSRLRESVADSDIIRLLATELEAEMN